MMNNEQQSPGDPSRQEVIDQLPEGLVYAPDKIKRLKIGDSFGVGRKHALFGKGELIGYFAGSAISADLSKAIDIPGGKYSVIGNKTIATKIAGLRGRSVSIPREVFLIQNQSSRKHYAFWV